MSNNNNITEKYILHQNLVNPPHMINETISINAKSVEELIFNKVMENSNTIFNPESINLAIAEIILKEYSFRYVYTDDVVNAHLDGYIHIHDAGMPNRPYCSGQSPAYVALFGLNVPAITSISKPAKHPESLIAHLLKWTSILQNHFAGAIGWDALNIFLAPYTITLDDRSLKQLLQMMVFEFNQLAGGRGGQIAFTDINLYGSIPKHFQNVKAIGPGGQILDKTYGEFADEARRILKLLFEVYIEGDAEGRPFFFPKPLFHLNHDFFNEDPKIVNEILDYAIHVAIEKGNTYFVFDRDSAKLSECCRLQFELTEEDLKEAETPWKMRYCALQNVSLNLPRLAYESKNIDEFLDNITKYMDLASKVHMQKKNFIDKLLSLGTGGPLGLLTVNHDGEPYLRQSKIKFLIGLVGLNEAIEYLTGCNLSEEKGHKTGLQVVQYMDFYSKILSEKLGLSIHLEQTPAESTAGRFAILDLKKYPKAYDFVKGDITNKAVFYTNSTHIPYHIPIDPIMRCIIEGEYHPYIPAGSITHIWLGESKPSHESLKSFIKKVYEHSKNVQVAFSPDFTICNNCMKTFRGLYKTCPKCNSTNVDGITRITGYFTKISSWNQYKKAELNERIRTKIS